MTAPSSRSILSLLLVLGVSLIAAGCVPLGTQTTRNDSRYPDTRRASTRAERVIHSRVSRDANRFVQSLDRVLRLNRRQEDRIARLLTDRAYDRVRRVRRVRSRDQNRAYPFPRRTAERAERSTRDWWRDADKRIERELDRRQRRVYRDIIRAQERSTRRADRDRHRGRRDDRGRYDDRRRGDDDDDDDG
jgi:hypothetical protein